MGRSRNKSIQIISQYGKIYLEGKGIDVQYRYRRWLFQLNPDLVPSGLRKTNRKVILMNGRKLGYAETRNSCIPLPQYRPLEKGLYGVLLHFVRCHLGWCCKRYERGYILIVMDRHKFVVTKSITEMGNLFCSVYFFRSGNKVATFTFDKDFRKVYPITNNDHWLESIMIMAGYVADTLIYQSVASQLNRTIEVVF